MTGPRRLRDLPNLGPASEAVLVAAGVDTPQRLEELGAVAAYRRCLAAGAHPSLNLLWALEGALRDHDWRLVPADRKAALLAELDAAG